MTLSRMGFRCVLGLGFLLGTLGVAKAGAMSEALGQASGESARLLTFETYKDQKAEHRWRLKSSNGQIIATSGQGYKDKRDCEHAIDVIKKGAEKAKVEEAKADDSK